MVCFKKKKVESEKQIFTKNEQISDVHAQNIF